MTALTPATAARLGVLADQLDAEALGRLPFASGELAEALAQGNAVRALVGPPGGKAGQCVWEESWTAEGYWESSCGVSWDELFEGGPTNNLMKFCFRCGLPLVEAAYGRADPWDDAEGPAAWGGGDPSRRSARAEAEEQSVVDLMSALKASLTASGKAGL